MKKYRIAVIVLCVLSLGFFLYVAAQGVSAKQDVETLKSAQDAATKLNSYTGKNGTVPQSLEQAGVKDNPSTITYQKLSSSQYKFCVTYKSKSSLELGGTASMLTGAYLGGDSSYSGGYSSGDSGYLYVSGQYKKGQNCQTVTVYQYGNSPYDYGGSYGSSSLATFCGQKQTYAILVTGTVKSVDTAAKTILIDSSPSEITTNGGSASLAATTTVKYTASTEFYDSSCAKMEPAAIKPGDSGYFYTNAKSGDSITADYMEIYGL